VTMVRYCGADRDLDQDILDRRGVLGEDHSHTLASASVLAIYLRAGDR
jgi:hypothetical protein